MANKRSPKKRRPVAKTVLQLADLDQAKSAVLNSLSSHDAQRGYRQLSMSSSNDAVESRDYRSARTLYSGRPPQGSIRHSAAPASICSFRHPTDTPASPSLVRETITIWPRPVGSGVLRLP